MPELPEVETVVEGLKKAGLIGRRIANVNIHWHRSISPDAPDAFRRQLTGRLVSGVQRRAKYICIILDSGDWLLVHLRMTGHLLVAPGATPPDMHDRIGLGLDDGRELRLHDTRKFARMRLVAGPDSPPLCDLGPEPLSSSFTVKKLATVLSRRRIIKPLLLDQSLIAGIGNIYADEALWEAGIHPMRRADTLQPDEIKRLHRAIRLVLRRGIRAGGTSLGRGHTNFVGVARQWGVNAGNLRVFRRHGAPCPRCKRPVERMIVAQRATHYCPECQPVDV